MLRCGQMVLAQALVNVHLGRNWFWEADTKDPVYLKILRRFEDRRQAPFSIHQIAQMGASEGKDVGQWFGPNTVAQVLKYEILVLLEVNDSYIIIFLCYIYNTLFIKSNKKQQVRNLSFKYSIIRIYFCEMLKKYNYIFLNFKNCMKSISIIIN